ncbi:hypothetical protein N9Y92_04560, partial [Chlamydiales bacterium]|nr:hypothetical protein [Chlamydiales bacterium]
INTNTPIKSDRVKELSSTDNNIYEMITAIIQNDEVIFGSENNFKEAMKVGFFRVKAPEGMNLKAGRLFASTFTSIPKYNQFGMLDVVNGYLQSPQNQTVRFSLEKDNWDKCHVDGKITEGQCNYPEEIRTLGNQMNEVGIKVLRSVLRQFKIPEKLWFEATGGATQGEGSHFLLFNCYDPKKGALKSDGVAAHKDWGHVTVLDATEPGLEAEINGVWKSIALEEGFLTINFGYPLEKLLPGINASNHRVITQTEKLRTSTVLFIDPRVGPYNKSVKKDGEGMVYDWSEKDKQLVNPETTVSFFTRLSNELYGNDQS